MKNNVDIINNFYEKLRTLFIIVVSALAIHYTYKQTFESVPLFVVMLTVFYTTALGFVSIVIGVDYFARNETKQRNSVLYRGTCSVFGSITLIVRHYWKTR